MPPRAGAIQTAPTQVVAAQAMPSLASLPAK